MKPTWDRATSALVIIDMFSDFRFQGAASLLRRALPVARRIARLKERMHAAGIPAIYVNDNPGRWRSDLPALIRACTRDNAPGAQIARLLAPGSQDHFIFKPRHSGFYGTALEAMLDCMKVRRLILTGVSSHQCVLFTATDAHVRDLALVIPSDCITAPTAGEKRLALRFFNDVLGADTRRSIALRPANMKVAPRGASRGSA
jgi:nicotinamidase-related amidase